MVPLGRRPLRPPRTEPLPLDLKVPSCRESNRRLKTRTIPTPPRPCPTSPYLIGRALGPGNGSLDDPCLPQNRVSEGQRTKHGKCLQGVVLGPTQDRKWTQGRKESWGATKGIQRVVETESYRDYGRT